MAHPHPASARQEQHVDDLTQIHGVSQAMEHKLNQAGIFTFAQLAGMSTEKLTVLFSHMRGWSAEKEKDLIIQAQELMETKAMAGDPPSNDNTQYLAQFSVDLLLDNQKRVRRTHIIHAQSGTPDSWAEWNQDRLADFILKNAMIKPDQMHTETVETKPILKNPRENAKQAKKKEIAGDLNISEVEIQTKSGTVTHWLVKAEERFAIRLTLDMSKALVSPDTVLKYQTEVYVKNLSDGKRHSIGENKGTLTSRNLLPLTINCTALPQGSYRLEAYITLSPDMEDSNPRSRLMAMTEGKVFRVN